MLIASSPSMAWEATPTGPGVVKMGSFGYEIFSLSD
jgi:hypothetical protein